MTTDRRLDNAIDRAVKGMVQIDPAPGLSRRVLTRLEAPDERRRMTVPRLAALAALGAAAVLAFVLLRPPVPQNQETVARTEQTTNPQAPVIAPPVGPPAAGGPHTDMPRGKPTTRIDRRVEAATVAQRERDGGIRLAPLTAIDPIGFAPVAPRAIELSQVSIDPLEIRPIRVEPLSSTPQ